MNFKSLNASLIFFLCGYVFATSFSLAELSIENSTRFEESITDPSSISSGTFAGRFIPSQFFFVQGQISFYMTNTIDFFHVLPSAQVPASLYFDGASINFPQLFYQNLSLSIFTGTFDDLSSDSLLIKTLKLKIPEPEFIGKPWDNALFTKPEVHGLGLSCSYFSLQRPIAVSFNSYWNTHLDQNLALLEDLRIAYGSDQLKLNIFAGLEHRIRKPDTYYRAGLTAFASPSHSYEIYSYFGFKDFNYKESTLEDCFSFIFEPRINFSLTQLSFSFFADPLSIKHEEFIGTQARIVFGNIKTHKMRGGLSLYSYYDSLSQKSFTPTHIAINPFYSIIFGDILLDFVTIIRPLNFQNYLNLFELQIKIQAVL